MMLDTWDGQIWYPRFYDIDTILSYDNSGEIKFDVDIEMEQGYWNTSASRLWTKVRDNFHDELVEVYKQMRGNGVTYEQIMYYMYDEQIAKIPQTYYNMDYDIKYAPYADQYIGKAHGDGYEHMKRWLKRRFIFCDTLYDYAPSYNNDVLTIRANTLNEMNLTIETYTPLYQHVSFYNGNMEKIKITPGQPVTFKGFAQTETDQEVLIYGGSNIKKITGIQSMNPNSMLIGGATRLTELDISNCPILTIVNSNKANFSPHTYLNKLNMSNCPQLGGNLNVSNSPLLQEIKARNSAVTGLLLPTSLRNLKTLELPNTISSLALYDAGVLENLKFDEGVAMQSIELSNCPGITNTENFDLTQTPTVILDNSYDTEELYMSATTNLTLRNMSNLERVIYTPNSEYSEFDINNVIGGKNYKVTANGCPKLSTFMTTAPHRLSYDNVEYKDVNVTPNLLDGHSLTTGRWLRPTTGLDDSSSTINAMLEYIEVEENTEYTLESLKEVASTICFYNSSQTFISAFDKASNTIPKTFTTPSETSYIRFDVTNTITSVEQLHLYKTSDLEYIQVKDYGDITPNTTFTANTLDLSATQFTDIKLLCTTDVYNLKVPTTMKNFYCDSAMDIDTDVIEDASYEVIHEELIEPYTTNYEGEVYKLIPIEATYSNNAEEWVGKHLVSSGNFSESGESWMANTGSTDYIPIKEGVPCSIQANSGKVGIIFFDESKTMIGYKGQANEANTSLTMNSPIGSKYVMFWYNYALYSGIGNYYATISYYEGHTPNIFPSSANGSLIFNMYSNNTTQPTSTSPYMWDLTGLKLEDFYTYGMNNNVKPSDDSYVTIIEPNFTYIEIGIYWYHDFCGGFGSGNQRRLPPILFRDVEGIEISANDGTTITVQIHKEDKSPSNVQGGGRNQGSLVTESAYSSTNTWGISGNKWVCISFECLETTEYIDIDIGIEKYRYYITDICRNATTGINTEVMKTHCIDINDISSHVMYYGNPTSITMPQRMSGYSVRLVNADITPDEYPTMLYPKLIDTTLPITGKLDYTKYNGTSLAWAYAYTTGDVNISPLDSRSIGQIEFDYNKLYGTDFVDVVDIWVYKDTDTSKLSINEAITKAYIELTGANYTTRVDEVLQWYPNCTDLYFFEDGTVTTLIDMFNNSNNNTYKSKIKKIEFMDGYFQNLTSLNYSFYNCTALTDISNIPSSVENMYRAFYYCGSLVNVSDLPDGVTNVDYTFYQCDSLVTAPKLGKSATVLDYTFYGCDKLQSIPEFPPNVTKLTGTFSGCSKLTSVPDIPNSVTDMSNAFYNCSRLVVAPKLPNSVNTLSSTFQGCSSLQTPPSIIPKSVTNASGCFNGCTSLVTPPEFEHVDGSDLYAGRMYQNCSKMTTAPKIPNGVNNILGMFVGCSALTIPPTIPDSVTNMQETFSNCTGLTQNPNVPTGVTNLKYAFSNSSITAITIPLTNLTTYDYAISKCPNLTDVTWVGELTSTFNVKNLYYRSAIDNTTPTATDIQELVPEHLGTVTGETLTLGDYISYLTEDEIAQATNKGWIIE